MGLTMARRLLSCLRLTPADREAIARESAELAGVDTSGRPRTRGECQDGPRPCPWVGCRYHLAIQVHQSGSIQINHPGTDLEALHATCALDVADAGPVTLEVAGTLLGLTRERVRQIEIDALDAFNRRMGGAWHD